MVGSCVVCYRLHAAEIRAAYYSFIVIPVKMSEAATAAPDAAAAAAEQIKSFRDFLYSYNKLSELCFTDCVWDFTSRTVRDQENNCAVNCAEKFLKANQRMSQRFQEFQMIANENALAIAKKVES